MNLLSRFFCVILLLLNGSAHAASTHPGGTYGQIQYNNNGYFGGEASTPVGRTGVNKASRAPNNNDDWTQGYYGDGSVDHLYLATGATGCSGTPTMSFSAPATGGITATGHFLMSQVTSGTIALPVIDKPGRGYTGNPTVTVSNTSGCSGTPAVTAFYNPNGQLWNDTAHGKMYIAHQADAGQATWMFVPTPSLPGDAVSAPVVLYGTHLLTKTYATNKDADIIRASDSTSMTIGFLNNAFDVSTAQNFCAGTTCKWSKIYDQSGNGYDAVQTTDANRPVLDWGQTINGIPLLVGGYMTIPSGATYDSSSETAYMLSRSDPLSGSGQGMGGYLFNAGIFPSQIYYQNFENNAFGYITSTNFIPSRAPEIIGGTVTNGSSCVWSINDWEFPTGATCANAGAQTGGTLGYTTSTQMAMGFFGLWAKPFTAAQRLSFRAAVYATYALAPQARTTLLTSGDSRTAGDFDTNGVDYPTQIEAMLPVPVRIYNVAKLGAQASDLVANCYAYDNSSDSLGDCIAASQPHDSNSWDVIWDGYNDCQANVPAATYYANLTTFIGYLHALNWKVAIVVDPGTSGVGVGACPGYNPLIIANTAGADLVINFLNDPVYTSATNWSSQTFYASGPHPSVFGQSYVATDISSLLNLQFK